MITTPELDRGERRADDARTPPATRPQGGRTLSTRLRMGSWGPYAAAVASLLAVWQIAAFFLPTFLLPDVPIVFRRLADELGDASFVEGLQASLFRLAVGYALASALGMGIGLLAGISRLFGSFARAVISILQSIPPITWMPLFLILMGFGNRPIIVVITLGSLYPMALSVMNATEGVNRVHIQLAQVMGASRRQLLTKVYAPEVFPAVVTGAQVSFGNAWRALIAAEMVGGVSSGLGWAISYSGEVADMPGVLMGIVVIGALAAFIDRVVLEGIKRRLLRYRYV